jgi:hypothetical protein
MVVGSENPVTFVLGEGVLAFGWVAGAPSACAVIDALVFRFLVLTRIFYRRSLPADRANLRPKNHQNHTKVAHVSLENEILGKNKSLLPN